MDSNQTNLSENGIAESDMHSLVQLEDIKNLDINDSGGFGLANSRPSKVNARMSTESTSQRYNMGHLRRGHCVVFNHKYFDPITQMGERNGTDKDRDSIVILFRHLGFEVASYDNLTVKQVKQELLKFSLGTNHNDSDAFILFYLSHGDDGCIFARDGSFKCDDLFEPFQADNCSSLAGKPKMFFIQACRGEGLDSGTTLEKRTSRDETDAGALCYKIPNTSDFLICWSTVPGYYSWRNTTNGSWFVQSLVQVFSTEARHEDVLSMMTNVNRYMINNFESNCPSNPCMHGKKQAASIVSTLMRKIYLYPKH